MQATPKYPSLAELEFLPYIDGDGQLPSQFEGKIGVYAIYNDIQELVYIGYSRDVALSLKQHLVRQPQQCYGVKAYTVERPNRTLLEDIKTAWIKENDQIPHGNADTSMVWEQPIDVKAQMLPAESEKYLDPQLDDKQHLTALKQAARRVEQEILTLLCDRGLQETLRFNPKLKENGFLDLK